MADIRRKSTVAQRTTAFGFAGDPMDIKKQLHLKHVSADWTVGGSLVVLLRMGHDLTIGTEASLEEQDLQLAGLGMAPSHCVVHVKQAGQSDRKRASAQEKSPGQVGHRHY